MKQTIKNRLEVTFSSARQRLIKNLLFHYVKKAKRNYCYRCGKILKESDFTIDHKIPWMYAKNADVLFMDVKNIAFSHFICNTKASRRGTPGRIALGLKQRAAKNGRRTCSSCRRKRLFKFFSKNKSNYSGIEDSCRDCRSLKRRKQ